jgi:hypothetical protein
MAEAKQKKTIVFTVGRMNPPTGGHMKLIDTMVMASLELPADDLGRGIVYIILSHTTKVGHDNKDPLACDRKRFYLNQGMIQKIESVKTNDNVRVKILCMNETLDPECDTLVTIMKQLCNIIKTEKNITNMEIIIGGDRQEDYLWIGPILQKKYNIILNEDKEKENKINLLLTRPDTSNESEEEKKSRLQKEQDYIFSDISIPLEDMSATLMRKLVIKNNPKFLRLYQQLGLSKIDAEMLSDDIKLSFLKDTDKVKQTMVPKKTPLTSMKLTTTKTKINASEKSLKKILPSVSGGNTRSKHKRSNSKHKRSNSKHKRSNSKHKRSKHKRSKSKNKRSNNKRSNHKRSKHKRSNNKTNKIKYYTRI